MQKHFLLLPFLLFLALSLKGQPPFPDEYNRQQRVIDSLIRIDIDLAFKEMQKQTAWVEANGNDYLKAHNATITGHMWGVKRTDYDSIYHYTRKAIGIFEEIEAYDRVANSYRNLGNYYALFGDHETALKELETGLKFANKAQDYVEKSVVLGSIGGVYKKEGDYSSALEYFFQSAASFDSIPDTLKKPRDPNLSIGSLMAERGDFEEGIRYMEKGLESVLKEENYFVAAQWYNNLAECYLSNQDTAAFREKLGTSIHYAQLSHFNYSEASSYEKLASFFTQTGELDSAKIYIGKIYEAVPEIREQEFLCQVLRTEGNYFAAAGNRKSAIQKLEAALALAQKSDLKGVVLEISGTLADLYKAQNAWQLAYERLDLHLETKDSLYGKEKIEEFKELELQNQFAKEQLEDSLAAQAREFAIERDLNQTRSFNLILFFVIGIVLVIAAAVVYAFLRSRKQTRLLDEKNKVIEQALHEKALLLKEVHHRVKNNFQIVSSLLELQSRGIEDEKAKQLAQEGRDRVKSMALIHQKLYQNDDLLIFFDDYIEKLVNEITAMYGEDKSVKTQLNVPNFSFDIDTAIPLGLIVNELVTNAYKYGFSEEAPQLEIRLEKKGEEDYLLQVRDNGQGLPEGFDFQRARSLGLRLVRRLARQLMGKVNYVGIDGCLFEVYFKDTAARALRD